MQALSIAVLMIWALTVKGSQIPYSFMSTNSPVVPLIPQVHGLPVESVAACFARNCVKLRITETPQFCSKVRGITSMASATARKGPC